MDSIMCINIPGVGLEALVEAENLASGGCRHRSEQERVANASLRHLLLQSGPVPEVGRSNTPHVVLEDTLRNRASFVRLVRAFDFSEIAAGLHGSVVDRLEDLLIELTCLGGFEGQTKSHERVGETVHTNADGAVAHVGATSLRDGVVVAVDDAVEVDSDDLGDIVELLEVVGTVLDEGWKGDGSQVTNSGLLWRRVLDDFGTQVRRLDRAQVLLVRFRYEKASVMLIDGMKNETYSWQRPCRP